MDKSFIELLMNPVRLRIIQYLMLNGSGTAAQIRAELSDIPQASLYRHLKLLSDGGCIQVTGERRQRGAVERTYALSRNMMETGGEGDAAGLIDAALLSLLGSFHGYFSSPENDAQRDMLLVKTMTLMLSDEEFMELLNSFGKVLEGAISNKAGEGRRARRLSIISSPCEE